MMYKSKRARLNRSWPDGRLPPFIICLLVSAASCRSVKPYQRAYLNDAAMQMGHSAIEKLSVNVHSYREAASGGSHGKGSGGCGCN